MRYRRIPILWLSQGSAAASALPEPKVNLIPRLIVPDADGELVARTDTTPLIRWLETEHPGRSVRPGDPVLKMLDALLEDFADEWLTKAMFHYRWAFDADIANAAKLLPRWFAPNKTNEFHAAVGEDFAKRQVSRLGVVGSNPTTAPIIEGSFLRILQLLDVHLSASRFLLGARPAACDFAFFGQLTQLTRIDPTPAALSHATSMRTVAWTDLMDDLSGLEPSADQWSSRDKISPALIALLGEVGRVYAPFLLGNARALEAGDVEMRCTIDGAAWVQKPFPYQGKCLVSLRAEYAALESGDRARVDEILEGTGCEALFAS